LTPHDTSCTPPIQPQKAPPTPQKALTLSREVDECKPLCRGTTTAGCRASTAWTPSSPQRPRCAHALFRFPSDMSGRPIVVFHSDNATAVLRKIPNRESLGRSLFGVFRVDRAELWVLAAGTLAARLPSLEQRDCAPDAGVRRGAVLGDGDGDHRGVRRHHGRHHRRAGGGARGAPTPQPPFLPQPPAVSSLLTLT